MATSQKVLTKGGEFLIKETNPTDIYIPENLNEEQREFGELFYDFLKNYVYPVVDKLDKMDPPNLMEDLLTKAGEVGMLGVSIPEEYGGTGLDFITSIYTTEILGKGFSFSVALAAHTGIGTLPILYFGTEEQKKKYLPSLASGEVKACYCLTEPGSGSDALGAKTKAILTPDGKHYVLNGQKMWITNAGFAKIFIVFAQVEGDKFTAFIVDKDEVGEGLSLGEEEQKMGIKGSSTRQVFFTDVKVPVSNVLGEIGKGHLIAFNILNIGRLKLGAAVLGGAKEISTLSIQYANERQQFGKSISSFGAIKHKLAEQAIRTYAAESAAYRVTSDIQSKEEILISEGKTYSEALLGAAQEYAAECAILKVLGSETLDYVSDEGVQVYGGYGFSADYPMDRPYRDSRINRIFEGTNEINRMLTVDYILKKAMKGQLDFLTHAMAVQKELMSVPDFSTSENGGFLAKEAKVIENLKKAILMTTGAAAQKYMQKFADEQEMLISIADMIIYVYAAESLLLRVQKLALSNQDEDIEVPTLICKTYVYDIVDKVSTASKNVINALAEGDELRVMLMELKRFTKVDAFNSILARRAIADKLIEHNKYYL